MTQLIAKVSRDNLAEFLARRSPEWNVVAPASVDEFLHALPATVDELMLAIELASNGEDFAYVFSPEMTPDEAVGQTNFDEVQEVDAKALEEYILQMGRAKDFLYVAPSLEYAANASYINLMPFDRKDSDEEDPLLADDPSSAFRITTMILGNFKGIPEGPVCIQFKPITLLYGPNSAGKSSILHALLYAREILERRNLDAGPIQASGNLVDLGGFASMVHDHERGERIWLCFTFDVGDRLIPTYDSRVVIPFLAPPPLRDVSSEIATGTVDIAVAWSELRESCYVADYQVGVNGAHVASIRCDFGRREVGIVEINLDHPLLSPEVITEDRDEGADSALSLASVLERWHGTTDLETHPIPVLGQIDALPRWGEVLKLCYRNLQSFSIESSDEFDNQEAETLPVSVLLTQLLVGVGELLRDGLAEFRYLGPLREAPPRNFVSARSLDPARWANGLAAWDILAHAEDDLVERVSEWLSERDRLGTGYRVEVRTIAELDLSSRLMAMLRSEFPLDDIEDVAREIAKLPTQKRLSLVAESSGMLLHPNDVGIGISQILPVVVLALDDPVNFAAVEQPELHVHPRVQVGLGDLFITKVYNNPACCLLVETHSEHLLLRLLRRVRETHDGELKPDVFPSIRPDQIAVYYVEFKEGRTVVRPLRIDETGEFIDRWPEGFFEERARELF